MKRISISIPLLSGFFLSLLGFSSLMGWSLHLPILVSFSPGYINMVFNTALCFCLSGLALIDLTLEPPHQKHVCLLAGSVALLIAGSALMEYLTQRSFGIDQLLVNAWMPDQNPFPGRMSVNTSATFLLLGMVFISLPFTYYRWLAQLSESMIFLIMLSGLTAMLGYFLKLEFLYSWYQYSRMGPYTSIGFIVVSAGLWSALREHPAYCSLLHEMNDKRIIQISSLIMASVAVIAGLSGYAIAINPDREIEQLYVVLPIILGTITVGTFLLHWMIAPLIQHILLTKSKLSYQAYYDTLTGLVNRNQLEESLDITISSALHTQQRFAIFFIDLDHFKRVNDDLGHDAGDQLLRVVGDRLKSAIRKTDVAARLGGDEFILVLNGADNPEIASVFAEKIINTLIQPIKVKEHELFMTASIGISFYPADGSDYEALLKSADLALYKAKESGRNNYKFCTPEMNNEIKEKLKFKNALQDALKKHEFRLVYLPKMDIQKNCISGFEALLRWESETYGDVSPTRIIPLTEEMGLISQLSGWIIKTSVTQAKSWLQENYPLLSIAINISGRHYLQPDFAESILDILNSTGLPGHCLELEITENLIMQDPDYSLQIIRKLKSSGIRIIIDNFGTGYSSINYLHQFCVDCIKIDRKFIADITTNPDHPSLLRAMVGLAKSMHTRVLAEGVETKEQFEILKRLGCDEVQGYYISHPVSAENIARLMQKTGVQPISGITS